MDPAIQKTGNSLTLAYKEVGWLEQPLATKVENINPFNVVLYVGAVELTPSVDTWVRQTWMATLNQSNTVNTSTTNVQKIELKIELEEVLQELQTREEGDKQFLQDLLLVVEQEQELLQE